MACKKPDEIEERGRIREEMMMEKVGPLLSQAADILNGMNMPFVFGIQILPEVEHATCTVLLSTDFDEKSGLFLDSATEILKSKCGCEYDQTVIELFRETMIARAMMRGQ